MKDRPAKFRKDPAQSTPLGLAIKIMRKEQNLTQEALADLAGERAGRDRLHKQRISEIENGWVDDPHPDTLSAIAEALDTTIEELYVKAQKLADAARGIGQVSSVGRDVVINLSIDGSGFDRDKLLAQLENFGIDSSAAATLLGSSTVEHLAGRELKVGIQSSFLKHNLRQAHHNKKYLHLSAVADRVGVSLAMIKSHAEQLHHCLGRGDYGMCHELLKHLLASDLLSAEQKNDLTFDFVQTGYIHYANSGNRSAIRELYSRVFDGDWRKLQPRLLCLLAEMQQEIATRDLDSGLLQENLASLSRFEEVCRADPETHEYLLILRALCLRRIGERGDRAKLEQSIGLHRKLIKRPTRRFIEISSSFGNALLRRYETDRNVRDLDEAQAVLSRVDKPKAETLLSELEAYPRSLNALGNACRHRVVLSGRSEDFARAIECYTKAESYWSEETSPYEWAMLQKNKAKATLLFATKQEVTPEFLQNAIEQAQSSMRYRTKEEAPYQHQGLVEIVDKLKRLRADLQKQIGKQRT